ncbi:nucleotidyltransferase family protein [Thiomicrorhabdus sediminis]|uniref:Nucleotidyltransferase family protein n=1 Tax=Thiomicrorhabdus sediminis TaxID=2580412 RepID=A0A4P9K7I3_9GAMM|nr:nucleotidyltransferase family protein [Thiomicrorhabdus sediminis]
MKAMILAAGRGNRLRPITDTLPKPLVPLCGKPLIEYHIEKLARSGVEEIIINHAWLGEQIEQTLGDGSRWGVKILYSAEPEGGLETAGGIINALPLLGENPFVLINGDVYCDFDFSDLIAKAQTLAVKEQGQNTDLQLGHLYLVPSPEHNAKGDFGLPEGRAQGPVSEQGDYTFSGLSVLHPQLFADMPVSFIALAPILRQAMQQQSLTASLQTGLWSDIGTLERLQATEALLCPNR